MEARAQRRPRGVGPVAWLLYNGLVLPLGWAAFHVAALHSPKVREGLRGRRGQWGRWAQRAPQLQGCVWFHATSVGEYEQARPVVRALKEAAIQHAQHVPTLVTVFSPSGWNFAQRRCEADALDYLPLDTPDAARRLLALLRPRALVFVKFDVWPNMVWAARATGVPVLLLDATLHRRSRRLMPGARAFFRRMFESFSAIGAISEDDAARFRDGLGVRNPVVVTGDTRAEQVVHRWETAAAGAIARALGATGWRYVALGSIWPADAAVILPAALDALRAYPDAGVIAAPHEPTPAHLKSLEDAVRDGGFPSARLSELFDRQARTPLAPIERARARVIVVDSVGVLAEIYRATAVSYVGGSFTTGVHNVMEPAVAGQPVLFGPRIHNAYEAERLVAIGSGFVVRTAAEAGAQLRLLLGDEVRRAALGQAAQQFVLRQAGATPASLKLLAPFAFGAPR